MKTLNLILDYQLPADSKQDVKELTISFLEGAIQSIPADQIQRRPIARLQRKMDEAKETLELEETEFDIITKAFKTAKFMPLASKYVVILEDELEKLKEQK